MSTETHGFVKNQCQIGMVRARGVLSIITVTYNLDGHSCVLVVDKKARFIRRDESDFSFIEQTVSPRAEVDDTIDMRILGVFPDGPMGIEMAECAARSWLSTYSTLNY